MRVKELELEDTMVNTAGLKVRTLKRNGIPPRSKVWLVTTSSRCT